MPRGKTGMKTAVCGVQASSDVLTENLVNTEALRQFCKKRKEKRTNQKIKK